MHANLDGAMPCGDSSVGLKSKHWALKSALFHRAPRPQEQLWSTRCRGFLPARNPPVEVPPPYNLLTELVEALPAALAECSFRSMVDARAVEFAPLEGAIRVEQDEALLERVHSLYGYIGKGYVLQLHRPTCRGCRPSSSSELHTLPPLGQAAPLPLSLEVIVPAQPMASAGVAGNET